MIEKQSPAVSTARVFAANASQRRLVIHPRRPAADGMFNVLTRLRLTGPLDTDRLERALLQLAVRHTVLRSTFALHGGQTVQIAHAEPHPDVFRLIDQHSLPAGPADESPVDALAVRLQGTSLSLDHGPVFQCTLVRVTEDEHELFLVVDHVVIDERSKAILIKDLRAYYSDPDVELDPAPQLHEVPPRDEVSAEDLDYWTRQLTPLSPRPLPDVSLQQDPDAFTAGVVHFTLTADATAALDRTAAAHRATPFSVMLAVYYAVLWDWTGTADTTMFVPTDTRNEDQQFDAVGFFQTATFMRYEVRPEESFATLLDGVKRMAAAAHARRHVPMLQILDALGLEYGDLRHPVYQTGFSYSSHDVDNSWQLDGIQIENLLSYPTVAQIELLFEVMRSHGMYRCEVVHALGAVDHQAAEDFARRFQSVLAAATEDPTRTVSALTGRVGEAISS
ncbi:condensation domain-containing protein [Streptomyces sp. GSL17-111]|uniref:condensation domain-containing protein n=1 Tax=Streptomyces sp. GSL17-111 TaxID=3121596 RepID=UPI0030F3BB26